MKTKIKFLSLIVLLIATLGIILLPSVPFVSAESVDNGYKITNYNVAVNVRANNSLLIQEEIEVNFKGIEYGASRGIYRNIPKTLTVTRELDGKWQDYTYGVKINVVQAKVIETNTNYEEITEENDNVVIVLRDKTLVNGKTRNYLIEYVYDIGYDRLETHDELYFNLLGDQWNTEIENFSFSINMPYNFEDEPNFYSGKFGTSEKSKIVNHSVIGKTIIGNTTEKINPNEALTIKLNLPNNYFNEVNKFYKTIDVIIIIATVLVSVIVLYFYYFLRKRRKVVITVEFYPPNKIDPVHLAYTLNGFATVKNLSSLIVYFASKGYLKIIDNDGEISLQKLKDLKQTAPSYQKTIFNALFDDSQPSMKETIINKVLKQVNADVEEIKNNKDSKTENLPVTLKSLEKSISVAQTFHSSSQTVATECGGRLEKKFVLYSVLMYALSALPIISFFVLYSARINTIYGIGGMLSVLIVSVISLILFNLSLNMVSQIHYKSIRHLFTFLAVIIFVVVNNLMVMTTFWENIVDPLYLKLITLIPIFLALVLAPKMIIFNEEYTELFGKTLGFKKNIVLVEKKRMEMLLKDNPSYFYDILPYAYVMGITNEFIKQFEGLAIEPPSWYVGNNTMFNVFVFSHLMHSSISGFSRNIVSKNTASGFGGKSIGGFGGFGGGFSGGGFGGGGGGRA